MKVFLTNPRIVLQKIIANFLLKVRAFFNKTVKLAVESLYFRLKIFLNVG